MDSLAWYSPYRSGKELGEVILGGCILGIGLALARCEGSHVIRCFWFHSCEYSLYPKIMGSIPGSQYIYTTYNIGLRFI